MTHKLYKNKEEIENWLKKYKIKKYELIENNEYGYLVNVNKDVDLSNNDLKNIRVKFNIINGTFDCSRNSLMTLNGCPEIVNGNFYCNNNELTSLEYCPTEIKGSFFPYNNQINSLEYFPEKVDSTCYLFNNPELGEVQNIEDFEELKKIHELIALNKKLEKEITLDNSTKNAKIKL